ncbi:hypothetical protein B7P43_G04102 [Cryptotermes secundus]|uniref:Uncharacterized protein n=1 Tax=Cryptotermes secundus TaxID=105785 RepID=A0A2J7R3W2_9NEOP|nr:hypothetical protein B7P43_G04102 [Cryptotermes secundus]
MYVASYAASCLFCCVSPVLVAERRSRKLEMSLDNMRGSYGRCPPFLVAGLLVVCIILTFNWWSLSSQNYDLIKQIEELGEQLKISSEEQELCVHHRLSAEGRMKILDAEVAQVRVNLLQERTDNDEMKKTLETKDEELRKAKKEQENSQKSTNICKTELESIKKLEITKDGTIESLQLEKKQLLGQLNKQKEKIQSLEDELKQAQAALEEAFKKKLPDVPGAQEKASPGNSDTMLADVGTASTGTIPDRMPINLLMCGTVRSLDCGRNCKKEKATVFSHKWD